MTASLNITVSELCVFSSQCMWHKIEYHLDVLNAQLKWSSC